MKRSSYNPLEDGLDLDAHQAAPVKQRKTIITDNRSQMMNVRLKQEENEILGECANKMSISKSAVMRIALYEFLAAKGFY